MNGVDTNDRVLILAPHPDDEAIGAGGLIQRVVQRGGDVRVVLFTNGERNPWPQRYLYKRWRITAADAAQWGARRAREATQSLATLGVSREQTTFFNLPDQQLSKLARTGDGSVSDRLRSLMRELEPSLLVVTSAQDVHADHRAAAWFAHDAIRGLGDNAPEVVTYVVHGLGAPERVHQELQLTDEERAKKRAAIECHTSQLLLSRTRFLAYARPVERFYGPEFDLVCIDSRTRERMTALRHSCRVVLGRSNPVDV